MTSIPDAVRQLTSLRGGASLTQTQDETGRAAFTQGELIHLSGALCSAVSRCERGAAVHRFADAEAGRRADMLAEIRELRDAVTLAPVGGPVPVRVLFGCE